MTRCRDRFFDKLFVDKLICDRPDVERRSGERLYGGYWSD
jgi:hypothetical protein